MAALLYYSVEENQLALSQSVGTMPPRVLVFVGCVGDGCVDFIEGSGQTLFLEVVAFLLLLLIVISRHQLAVVVMMPFVVEGGGAFRYLFIYLFCRQEE